MTLRRLMLAGVVASSVGLTSAWAQIAVTDPATTGRNAEIAAIKERIVDIVRAQHDRLQRMARRLSTTTDMHTYATAEPPTWDAGAAMPELTFGQSYALALRSGDATGAAYADVTRNRAQADAALTGLDAAARIVLERALATLDAADSANIVATHQAGVLRTYGQFEQSAIDALESAVIDPSDAQSATAVLDKISAGSLLEAQQKHTRLQYLTAVVEQLVIDNKRARDTEAAVLNMRLRQLQEMTTAEEGSWITGTADDLRTWRQP